MTPAPDDLPPALRPALPGAVWTPVTVGLSGARVWRATTPGQPARYLKRAVGPLARELGEERERLAWLAGRLPVPAVEGWVEDADGAWLLLSALDGVMAHEAAEQAGADIPATVRALGAGLRRVHDLPIADCPFDAPLDSRLASTAWRIAAGLIDADAIHRDHGIEPVDFLRRLEATRPPEPPGDRVFTHGDYCLPNILLSLESPDGASGPRVSGYLDWGRAGVSDRYQDLAIGARSLRYNLGPGWETLYFAAYGLAAPDPARMAWYEALDELF